MLSRSKIIHQFTVVKIKVNNHSASPGSSWLSLLHHMKWKKQAVSSLKMGMLLPWNFNFKSVWNYYSFDDTILQYSIYNLELSDFCDIMGTSGKESERNLK